VYGGLAFYPPKFWRNLASGGNLRIYIPFNCDPRRNMNFAILSLFSPGIANTTQNVPIALRHFVIPLGFAPSGKISV